METSSWRVQPQERSTPFCRPAHAGAAPAAGTADGHAAMERRAAIPGQEHLPPSLLRLSVGIEDAEDLWVDLGRAICAAAP